MYDTDNVSLLSDIACSDDSIFSILLFFVHCKNIRRFYGKITDNQLPSPFPVFLRAPVNIFRNQAQYGSKKTCIAFGHIALKLLKIFSNVVG